MPGYYRLLYGSLLEMNTSLSCPAKAKLHVVLRYIVSEVVLLLNGFGDRFHFFLNISKFELVYSVYNINNLNLSNTDISNP